MHTLAELYAVFDSPPDPVVEFLERLAEAYRLPRPLDVLDVGCGPGRLLRPLEQLRWTVTGLEPNPELLEAARSVARASRRLEVRRGGFLDIVDDEAFDLVCAVNSSFAHLLLPAERLEAVERMYGALRPGGVLFLDLPNSVWTLSHARAPEPHTCDFRGREVTLHRRQEIDYHAATLTTRDEYVFADGSTPSRELVHVYGLVALPELEACCRAAGFEALRTYRSYASRGPERLDGPRILLAAQKPRSSGRPDL